MKTLSTLSAALLAGATLLISAAGIAFAQETRQTPGSGITVVSCDPHRHLVGTPAHPWIDPYGMMHPSKNFPYQVGFLGITYRNNAPTAVREIDFGLVARQSLIAVVKDVGTFAQGATIDHEFSIDPEVFPIGTALPYCAVLRVKYADGKEWNNPAIPRA